MKKYTSQQLIDGFTFIHNLDFQADIQDVCSSTIRTLINTSSEKVRVNKSLSQLDLDLQKKILLSKTILDYLTGLMMKKNISSTEQQLQGDLPSKFEQIRSLAFNQEGNKIIAGYGGRTAGFWGEQRSEGTLIIFDSLSRTKTFEERIDTPINTACFDNDSTNPKILVGLDYTNGPTLTLIKGNVTQHFAPPSIAVNKAIFNPMDNKQILAAFDRDQDNLLLYNANNGNLIKNFNFPAPTQPIIDIAYSPDGTKIISASKGKHNNLKLWDNTGLLIRSFDKECPGSIGSVAFSPDGKKIVVAYTTGTMFFKTAFLTIDISDINKITIQTIPLPISTFQDLSCILTKKNQIIAWKKNKSLFFITIDNNDITNMIPLQNDSSRGEDCIYALSPDNKKIACGQMIGTVFNKNVIYLSTLLNESDEKLLTDLEKFNLDSINLKSDHLKIIYQFWLNARKGIEPSQYKMDATEQKIFNSFPEQIQRLFR